MAMRFAAYAGRCGIQALQAFKTKASTTNVCAFHQGAFRPTMRMEGQTRRRDSNTKNEFKASLRAARQLSLNTGKTGGRNSKGRITIFHRGGGAKRLYRKIDLKRNTSCMGVIERVEYDPNRSSQIALVRWVDGVQPNLKRKYKTTEEFSPPSNILEPTTTNIRGRFSLTSLSGNVGERNVGFSSHRFLPAYVTVGSPTETPPSAQIPLIGKESGSKITSIRDALISTFSSSKAKGKSASLAVGGSNFPRIAVAGAKPTFFSPQMKEEARGKDTFSLNEVRKWRPSSDIWEHRIKRKAAVSWQSLRFEGGSLGLLRAARHYNLKA